MATFTFSMAFTTDWDRQVYEESYPLFKKNYDNGFKYAEVGDPEFACKSFRTANNELKNHSKKDE